MSQGNNPSVTFAELEQEAKAVKLASPNLCIIWKGGGKAMFTAIMNAIKPTHPQIAMVMDWISKAIDILCP